MIERVTPEWEPYWDCPKCGCLTSKMDEANDWGDDGDAIRVVCHHADPADEGADVDCGHTYIVYFGG